MRSSQAVRASASLNVAASDTRTNLLETAWRLIEKRGVANVTLRNIADTANVSRQTVYLHFGNRAGLLIAMTRHRDTTSKPAREMVAAAREPNIRAGFDRFVRCWFLHVVKILPVARAIEATPANSAQRSQEHFPSPRPAPAARSKRPQYPNRAFGS
jgi:AcrR family transcriptional regulator